MIKTKLLWLVGLLLIDLIKPKILQASPLIIEASMNASRRSSNLMKYHYSKVSRKLVYPILTNKIEITRSYKRSYSIDSKNKRLHRNLTFRQVNNEELNQVAQLRWRFQIEDNTLIDIKLRDKFIEDCSQVLKNPLISPQFSHFGAFNAFELIAVASIHRIRMLPRPGKINDEFGYITNMYTLPTYRNRGIGEQILKNIKEWALTQDFELLMVWPSEKSTSFYKKFGFREEGQPYILKLRDY